MKNQKHKIELLSPAKDKNTGIAAIRFGADAVYIGALKFGARASAGNSIGDIEKLVNFAHIYRAKVYVTLNTILKDAELEEAETMINNLYNIGIDGLIIQDMGIMELDLPPLKLIASTQTNNVTPEKVKFLEDVGFQRVILARELSLEEIREIRNQTTIELEFFTHGSLCVCYSGQCYMSYALGWRSGNRGVCAQPCRKLYSLVDAKGNVIEEDRHLLSLKDLNLSDHLEDLIDAGITSFKIEGRLKDESYVKNTTAFYRQKLDAILEKRKMEKASVGRVFFDFTPDPGKTFNREYTNYFLKGRQKSLARTESPKFIGKAVGKVTGKKGNSIKLNSPVHLNPGDGICFYDKDHRLSGTSVNGMKDNFIQVQDGRDIKKGTVIYRNFDKEFSDSLKKSGTDRKIRVFFSLIRTDEGIFLKIKDENGIETSLPWIRGGEKPHDRKAFEQTIERNLSKLGNTEFIFDGIEIKTENYDFCSIKDINHLRRNLVENLKKERVKAYKREEYPHTKNTIPCPAERLDYKANVLNRKACNFYIRHGIKKLEPTVESGLEMSGRRLMKNRYCIKYELNLCPRYDKNKDTGYREPFFLVDEDDNRFQLTFDCKSCHMEIKSINL